MNFIKFLRAKTKKNKRKTLIILVLLMAMAGFGLIVDPSGAQAAATEVLVDSLPPNKVQGFKKGEGVAKMTRQKKVARKILPHQKPKIIVKQIRQVSATGYSSTPWQTSGNPFITASGKRVHWGTIASNDLPFGTKIRIPRYYGNKIFVVEDTGGFGYGAIDIWFDATHKAISWGRRAIRVEILS